MVCRALIKGVHVPSLSQSIRQRAFEVFSELLDGEGTPTPAIRAIPEEVLRWVMTVHAAVMGMGW